MNNQKFIHCTSFHERLSKDTDQIWQVFDQEAAAAAAKPSGFLYEAEISKFFREMKEVTKIWRFIESL